jgi:subtilisin family serine protease
MEREYIVSLNKGVDYDQFWNEIENASPEDRFVPSRRVDIVNNRDLSERSCHYALTDEEAATLRRDPRVAAVAIPAPRDVKAHFFVQAGDFNRGSFNGSDYVNWGLRRCILEQLESTVGDQYPYCIDGTGVDIVIQDNGVMSGHPEWQGRDGVSRFIEHDWFKAAGVVGTMPAGHYGDVGNHGTHVAGIAAGKTYGWAKGAKIYSIRYDLFESEAFDLIKVWHQNKPIDPKTGYKRPTIVNASWGYRWFYDNNGGGGTQVNRTYRGVTTTTSSTSAAEGQITAYGGAHNFTYGPSDVDQQELTDAGVICVRAAGNYYHKIDTAGGLDWDNNYTYSGDWAFGIVPAGDPIYYHRGGSPWSADTIIVSNVDRTPNGSLEQLQSSSERGPGVYISAPGTAITSATNSDGFSGYNSPYPGNSSYQVSRISGTSMAAPQVTGMLALYLQLNPNATVVDCKNWLATVASKEVMYTTTLDNDYTNTRSLMGQSRKFMYFPYAKDVSWNSTGLTIRKT